MSSDPSLALDPLAGTRYRAVRPIARGAMGEVWLAEHRAMGRKCVVKLLHEHLGDNAQLVDRMRLEAQTLGRLRHPNIVNILGASVTVLGRPFLVLERLRGRTLREAFAEGLLPVEEGLRYAEELLSAVALAHGLGVVHRDIKPPNLFLAETRHGTSLKVLDFGVARVLPSAPPGAPMPLAVPTKTGAVIGTPGWMSPEMRRGTPADEQADLFAVGLVLYEIVVGQRLEDVEGGVGVPPSELVPGRSCRALDAVLARALNPTPGARFVSAEHFLDEVRRLRRAFPDLMRTSSRPGEVVTVARPVLIHPRSTAKAVALFLGAAVLSAGAVLLASRLF